jgi:hypothetical protein
MTLLNVCVNPLNFLFFFAVLVVSEDGRRFVIHRTSCCASLYEPTEGVVCLKRRKKVAVFV